ncbi:retrovirus-related pol polyprotein from transposon TNT 1-94 [Tanacetum coccineum]
MEAKLSSRCSTQIASMYQALSYVPKMFSRGNVPDVCDIRTSYSLPPEETSCSLPLKGTSYSLPPEETCCFLPPEGTSYSLPPEETCYSLPPEGTSYSLAPEETCCSLPPEGTSYSLPSEETCCSLPHEGTSYSLPLEETCYSLVITFGPKVAFVTLAIPVWQALLAVRSLVLTLTEDSETWLKFASLCQKSGRISQAKSTLIKLLQVEKTTKTVRYHGPPQVMLAYLKYQWSLRDDQKRKDAFARLQVVVVVTGYFHSIACATHAKGVDDGVYELPDSHCLLERLDRRDPDDLSPFFFAIWTPGETLDSFQPPEGKCRSHESGVLCNDETCFFCNSAREANSKIVRRTLLVFFDLHLTLLMAKKDMHMYVSQLKDTELKTLIATYDFPLDLRPRLSDPDFRMINLPAGDTAIGIYSRIFDSSGVRIPFSSFLLAVLRYFKVHISQVVPLGDWFSFSKRGDPAPVCMEVAKSGLKLWKGKFFLIDHKVPTNFNKNHVDQLKAHIVKLYNIPEGVLVRSGLSRVWRNPMCDPVLRRFDNTVMSIYDFLCMPSLDKATVWEEPHGLDTSILGRVANRTTSPAPAGTAIPRDSLEEIAVTRPDRKVVTKADHAAKRKASIRPEIYTNVTKKIRSSKKGSGAGFSRLAARDEVEQTDDGTLDDDDQRDGSEFVMEDIRNLNDVRQGDHINVIPLRTFDPTLGLDVTYRPILLPDKEVKAHAELSEGVRRATRASFHASHGVSEDASSPTQKAMPAPNTQPLDAGAGADEIASDGDVDPYYEARVSNIAGMCMREIFFLLPRGLIISLILMRKCAQQTQTIKKQSAKLKQQNESTVHANEEVPRKYRNEKDALAIEKENIEEELSDFTPLVRKFLKSSEFNRAFAGVLNTAISVGVECGLRMDYIDEELRGLSHRVYGFILDAKEKFDRVVAAFPDTTFPFLGKTSSTTVSLRANTHIRHSTSSSGTFGHTSTLENSKKKKKFVEKGDRCLDLYGPGLLDQYDPTLSEQLPGCGLRASFCGKPTLAVFWVKLDIIVFCRSFKIPICLYSPESIHCARKGEVFAPIPSAAESISRGCSA